jgi:hypothetical protein
MLQDKAKNPRALLAVAQRNSYPARRRRVHSKFSRAQSRCESAPRNFRSSAPSSHPKTAIPRSTPAFSHLPLAQQNAQYAFESMEISLFFSRCMAV